MESILSTFGIDWRLLMVNMVNFGLLLLGLWYFLYGPVMRMLEERRQKITEGVEAADRAQKSLMEIESGRDATLSKAAHEADDLLAKARVSAAQKEKELRDASLRSAESLLKEAELQAKELKARAVAESREEVAKLIVLGIEKTMSQQVR